MPKASPTLQTIRTDELIFHIPHKHRLTGHIAYSTAYPSGHKRLAHSARARQVPGVTRVHTVTPPVNQTSSSLLRFARWKRISAYFIMIASRAARSRRSAGYTVRSSQAMSARVLPHARGAAARIDWRQIVRDILCIMPFPRERLFPQPYLCRNDTPCAEPQQPVSVCAILATAAHDGMNKTSESSISSGLRDCNKLRMISGRSLAPSHRK